MGDKTFRMSTQENNENRESFDELVKQAEVEAERQIAKPNTGLRRLLSGKRRAVTATIMCAAALSPISGLYAYDWYNAYRESLNDFTLTEVCKIKKGINIDDAVSILGDPVEYHNYNFGNVYSVQYRNLSRNYFLEIYYTTGKGTVTEIFWGQGREKTLVESGACSNIGSQ